MFEAGSAGRFNASVDEGCCPLKRKLEGFHRQCLCAVPAVG